MIDYYEKVDPMTYIKSILNNKLFKSTGLYTMSTIINAAIPFLLMPLLTRYLTPEDYGIVSMVNLLVSFISPFVGLNVHGAIARMYYERDRVDLSEYIFNCLLILIFSTSITTVFVFVFSSPISKVSSVPVRMLWFVILFSFCQFVSRIVLTLWQVEENPIRYGIFQISQTTVNVILSIIYVVVLKYTWTGRIYAQAITLVLYLVISIIIICKNNWLRIAINKNYIRNALKFGLPLVPHALGGILMTMTDRLFITNMVGIKETGLYTVGYQIGMIISILSSSFNQAYVPWLYGKLKLGNVRVKTKIVKFTYIYFVGILVSAIFLSIFTPLLLRYFVGKEFQDSGLYVTWVALGYAFNGMYLMVSSYIFYAERTTYLAVITAVSAIMNIVMNYIFIRSNGAVGAAQATCLLYLINFILTWVLAAKVYDMPWNLLRKSNSKDNED